MTVLSVNFVLSEPDKALVSVDERGFRFGDGAFETILVRSGKPYLWDYHIKRLSAGLAALRIPAPTQDIKAEALRLITANQLQDGIIRIYVSRGIGSRGYLPTAEGSAPTVVMQTMVFPPRPVQAVTLWVSSYEKISPKALPTHCKIAQGVNPALTRMEARDHDCYDALQCNAQGHIAETSSANIFWLKAGRLYTPSLACGALAGVTRQRIMELSPYPAQEGEWPLETLATAEAVILTNASMGIIPVKALLPLGLSWQSEALAHTLTRLCEEDISKQ